MEIVITIAIVGVLIFIGLILWVNSKRNKINPRDEAKIREHWANIRQEVQIHPKAAVVEGDKLLDQVLKLKGFQGTLGEKLKKAAPLFTNSQGLWQAHKLRNRIAHEMDCNPSKEEAITALKQFRQAMNDLGIPLE
ncbi:MAG: hypothetical protein UW70_C0027G0025 [Candidatus Peregrinibacteria bacterium GW2011_GWA2_44_7]|nr:MAG: hypothetical protein UW70_C0027G0025 [Candidatus Peregrinibacteria bacterium GW2011_GWA2_44_7]